MLSGLPRRASGAPVKPACLLFFPSVVCGKRSLQRQMFCRSNQRFPDPPGHIAGVPTGGSIRMAQRYIVFPAVPVCIAKTPETSRTRRFHPAALPASHAQRPSRWLSAGIPCGGSPSADWQCVHGAAGFFAAAGCICWSLVPSGRASAASAPAFPGILSGPADSGCCPRCPHRGGLRSNSAPGHGQAEPVPLLWQYI